LYWPGNSLNRLRDGINKACQANVEVRAVELEGFNIQGVGEITNLHRRRIGSEQFRLAFDLGWIAVIEFEVNPTDVAFGGGHFFW
jgi:hypothetical protein